jgi:hypothetical protein
VTILPTGKANFTDADATNFPTRFYLPLGQ